MQQQLTAPAGPPNGELLTISEIARLLHAHPNSVRRWTNEGLLKCYRVGKRGDRRFAASDVNEFLVTMGNGYY